ncbi:3-deoxy-D-manno-octulosonate 8-phosphate phosphatase, YrbI family [Candidatus Magnetobacterium bavaricum]|uniref:3-deoxy-D-manno-octulosonate 8-phosphate phosphatase, YrbI family n=1 Tax=Candidatus Magnetobacterium bavaricum TaxID=29290 RepID=A0A0F3GK68_9BACT|nr:3-deoxy-D-manno-octulosonate 8-phosphate phosphatase, YrbI family [Candidatus Magnetobacterium bavaricum]
MYNKRAMEISPDIIDRARGVRAMVLDVDGVLTDGSIVIDPRAEELKTFNVRDGQGIKMLQRAGIVVCIISGRSSRAVEKRAQELGITECFLGCHQKGAVYEQFKAGYRLKDEETACMGDDLSDIVILKRVGLAITVSDGDQYTAGFCHYVTTRPGGKGAVREVCDLILKAKGLYNEIVDGYAQV